MAFLVPLLLPAVIDATANVALGITNAVQGTSSSVTFQIGSHVYTSAKGFPLYALPEEIREEIILMALEGSKDLIQQSILVSRPFTLAPTAIPIHHPLHDPKSPHYRSIRGEWNVTNGYPVSAWRWVTVDREWRDCCRRVLWRDVVLDTPRSYHLFLKFLENGQLEDDILARIHSLHLDQGFQDPSEIYQIIRHPKLCNIRRLSILPSWPYSSTHTARPSRLFKFGLQLVPAPPAPPLRLRSDADDDESSDTEEYEREDATKRLDCFTLGLPLDLSTNKTSRQHLALLAPHRLEITLLLHPNPALLTELADLLATKTTTLSIRYLASDRTHTLPDPTLLLCSSMDRFHTIDIHLPSTTAPSRVPAIISNTPYTGQQSSHTSFSERVVDLIEGDEERRRRYAVWLEGEASPVGGGGFGPGVLKPSEHLIWERETDVPSPPNRNEEQPTADVARGSNDAGSSAGTDRRGDEGKKAGGSDGGGARTDHWERETNLRLFGGLLALRLESKKH